MSVSPGKIELWHFPSSPYKYLKLMYGHRGKLILISFKLDCVINYALQLLYFRFRFIVASMDNMLKLAY